MSDQNRIVRMDGSPTGPEQIAITTGYAYGVVEIAFEPPASKLRFGPAQARQFAIKLLQLAEVALIPPESGDPQAGPAIIDP